MRNINASYDETFTFISHQNRKIKIFFVIFFKVYLKKNKKSENNAKTFIVEMESNTMLCHVY